MHNNSEGKKQQVEDHRRNFMLSNNKTSVTACNDSLNAKTSNVNFVCVTCEKCVLNDNHDMCVLHYINGMNSRTKMPMVVPMSTREPKRTMNQSVAITLKRTIAVGNDQIAPILGYGDLVQGNVTIERVYYVEGQNHNLFSVGQFCDADLEVAFRKSTCYISDLKENDLLIGSRGADLYSITLQSILRKTYKNEFRTLKPCKKSLILLKLAFEIGFLKPKRFRAALTQLMLLTQTPL
nr:integrase, catalytic region, zinc finger, CCHC-type, peptidase aspartic, catalytic [Tanacetum cinerariifolium]